MYYSINFFHLTLDARILGLLLQGWEVLFLIDVVVLNGETQLDHLVDAVTEVGGVIESESGGE